jgi:hypothetical protein
VRLWAACTVTRSGESGEAADGWFAGAATGRRCARAGRPMRTDDRRAAEAGMIAPMSCSGGWGSGTRVMVTTGRTWARSDSLAGDTRQRDGTQVPSGGVRIVLGPAMIRNRGWFDRTECCVRGGYEPPRLAPVPRTDAHVG